MSNNNVPTEPGFYYRGSDVVRVRMNPETNLYSGLVYYEHGMTGLLPVEDDGLWRGPVPMPGEWAPMDLFNQLWAELSKTSPTRGSSAADILQRARAWDDPEATP